MHFNERKQLFLQAFYFLLECSKALVIVLTMTFFLVIFLIISALLEKACDNTIYLVSSKLSNLFSGKSFAFQFVYTPDASNCLL